MAEGSNVITGAIAGLAALLGVFATWQSTVNSSKIETARVEQEREQQNAEYRLAVFERVADAIENAQDSPQQMRAAVLLVNTLPDDGGQSASLKQQLLVILVEGGVAAGGEAAEAVDIIRNQTSDVPEAGVTRQMQAPAVTPPLADAPSAVQAPSASRSITPLGREATRGINSRILAGRAAGAWNVDVFYCDGAGEARNQANATAFNQALAAEAQRQGASDSPTEGMATRLGQVRLRPLTADAYKKLGYEEPADFVRAESSETQAAANLAAFAQARGAQSMTVVSSRQPTPYYLATYYCSARG